MKPKVLVTGANGQLGRELQLLAHQVDVQWMFTTRDQFDVTDQKQAEHWFHYFQPDVLINCAAYTAVDKAESEQELAFAVNAYAPELLSALCKQLNTLFIHISTDYVFDGQKRQPYVETDLPHPLNVYGRSKLEGERRIQHFASRYLIIRTSWLYSSYGHNFVKTIIRKAKEVSLLKVVNDQIGNPTYARDLADTLIHLTLRHVHVQVSEILHYSNEGGISWYDFACEILRQTGMNIPVEPIITKDFPTPALRPAYSVLDCTYIQQKYGIGIRHWKDSLQSCLKKLLQG